MRFLLLSVVLCVVPINGRSEPLVQTALGQIKGSTMKSFTGQQFFAFRGIRYAKAPVGQLRFEDPVPVDSWDGIVDATREGPSCLQFDGMTRRPAGTEDCLALNVYTRNLSPEEGPRPVMVWIHGGGFIMGSGNGETYLYGPKYFMDQDVVLVTINYRLGPFGFYSTGTKKAPGNYGLLDQVVALKWVQEHIHHFGGNAESVTIFGESAGGASVHYHILSPQSKGLFHRAIAQSGTSLCPWAMPEAVSKHSALLAEKVGCLAESVDEQIECVKSKKADQLILQPDENFMPTMDFGPRVDLERSNPFVPAHPSELLKQGNFNHVPFITGVTENEGLAFIGASGLLSSSERTKQFDENPTYFLKHLLTIHDSKDAVDIALKAIDQYLQKDASIAEQIVELDKMVSDFTFFKCTEDVVHAQLAHNAGPVYYYLYSHHGQYSMPKLYASSSADYGVCHGDEIFLMFSSFLPPSTTPEDSKVSKILIDLWTSFASLGKPTSAEVPEWTPTAQEEARYLNINANPQMVTGQMPFSQRLPFWNQFLHSPSLARDEL